MTGPLAPRAGSAVLWRSVQLLAVRGVSLARFLILSLILAPDAFGLLAIAAVAVEAVMALTDFGMEPALLQRVEPTDRHWNVGWSVRVVRSTLVAGVVAAAAPIVAELFGAPDAVNVVRVLALRPVIDSLASIKTVELGRRLDYRALALIALPATAVEAIVSVGLAEAFEVWALVAGALTGTAAATALSYVLAPYRPQLQFDRSASTALFRFGRWILAMSIIGVVGGVVLQAVVSRRLGAAELGVYYLAMRLAFLPNELVTDVVRDVAFPVHAGLQSDRKRSAEVFRSTLVAMLAMVAIAYGALIAVASSLSEEVLGSGWEGSFRVIQILSVAGIIGALADATMPMLNGHGRPELVTALYGIRSVVVVAGVWPLAGGHGIVGAAVAWLAAEVGVQAGCIIFAGWVVPRPFAGLGRRLLGIGVAAGLAALVAWGVDGVVGGAPGVFIGGAAGVVAGASTLGWLDLRWRLRLRQDLARAYPRLASLLRLPDA